MDITGYNIFLGVMVAVAIIVFIALHYVKAGYGIMYSKSWGPSVNNKLGWVLMESPVFIAMMLMWWFSDKRYELVPVIFLIIFQIH